MIFAEERLDKIMSAIESDGKVFVKQLSKQFDVTEDMIRKDLQKLHAAGKIQRTYGGAIALQRTTSESAPLSTRLMAGLAGKQQIARLAYSLIKKDQSTIFLDVSSINYALAGIIANENRKITIVTNMLKIADLFTGNTSAASLFFAGGKYHNSIGATIGVETIATAANYSFDYGFFGCCGINAFSAGVYNFDPEEGRTKAAFLKSSRCAWLLTETGKFSCDGAYRYAKLNDFCGLVCDQPPTPEIAVRLHKKKLDLLFPGGNDVQA